LAASAPGTAEGADPRVASRSPARRQAASTADPGLVEPSADRAPVPAIRVLDTRDRSGVADAVERHEADARPFVDALGRAFDLAPILLALALGGALCVASRRLRRAA
jgi:hypothetical protein